MTWTEIDPQMLREFLRAEAEARAERDAQDRRNGGCVCRDKR